MKVEYLGRWLPLRLLAARQLAREGDPLHRSTAAMGSHQTVNLPINIPTHEFLEDLEPLGW